MKVMTANVWVIFLVLRLLLVFAFAGLLCLLRQLREVLSLEKRVVERGALGDTPI